MKSRIRHRTRAFTLVESLAVVALLALIVSVVATGLGPTAEHASIQHSISSVLDADARARTIARRGESVELMVHEGTVRVSQPTHTTALVERQLFTNTVVVLLDARTEMQLDTVPLDARGHSPDYFVDIRTENSNIRLYIAGLTGYSMIQKESTP